MASPHPNPRSIRNRAREAGIPFTTLYKRLKAGWSLERALTPYEPVLYSYRGKTMTMTEWAKEIGMNPATLSGRLKRMTLGQAIRRDYKKKFNHNLSGRFGRLVIVKKAYNKKDTSYHCVCDCGSKLVVKAALLVRGQKFCSKSAECRSLSSSQPKKNPYRPHLVAKEMGVGVEYTIWLNRRRRGLLPEEWLSFWDFIECVGRRPNINWQLRKENPKGPYDSTNVGWIKVKGK
jgi:hypothetical protein